MTAWFLPGRHPRVPATPVFGTCEASETTCQLPLASCPLLASERGERPKTRALSAAGGIWKWQPTGWQLDSVRLPPVTPVPGEAEKAVSALSDLSGGLGRQSRHHEHPWSIVEIYRELGRCLAVLVVIWLLQEAPPELNELLF